MYKQPSPRKSLVPANILGIYILPLLDNIYSPTFISLPIFHLSFLVLKVHLMTFACVDIDFGSYVFTCSKRVQRPQMMLLKSIMMRPLRKRRVTLR